MDTDKLVEACIATLLFSVTFGAALAIGEKTYEIIHRNL